jgi:hypothetical protein
MYRREAAEGGSDGESRDVFKIGEEATTAALGATSDRAEELLRRAVVKAALTC